jgi:hypothetical protein
MIRNTTIATYSFNVHLSLTVPTHVVVLSLMHGGLITKLISKKKNLQHIT